MLRTGKQPLPGFPVLVNPGLDIGQQFRDVLDFVNDERWLILIQETEGIFLGSHPHIRVFQTDKPVRFREEHFQERGLS